jgi:hypothetical protein
MLTPEECDTDDDIAGLVCPKSEYFFPCVLYTAWGTRISSCTDLSNGDSVFIVPEDRLFMIPTKGVGHRTEILHLSLPTE